jgi:hypothetical protein
VNCNSSERLINEGNELGFGQSGLQRGLGVGIEKMLAMAAPAKMAQFPICVNKCPQTERGSVEKSLMNNFSNKNQTRFWNVRETAQKCK